MRRVALQRLFCGFQLGGGEKRVRAHWVQQVDAALARADDVDVLGGGGGPPEARSGGVGAVRRGAEDAEFAGFLEGGGEDDDFCDWEGAGGGGGWVGWGLRVFWG